MPFKSDADFGIRAAVTASVLSIATHPAARHENVPAGSVGRDGAGGSRFLVSPGQHRVIFAFGPPKAQASIEAAVKAAFAAQ